MYEDEEEEKVMISDYESSIYIILLDCDRVVQIDVYHILTTFELSET
jgi:hypothetical protein